MCNLQPLLPCSVFCASLLFSLILFAPLSIIQFNPMVFYSIQINSIVNFLVSPFLILSFSISRFLSLSLSIFLSSPLSLSPHFLYLSLFISLPPSFLVFFVQCVFLFCPSLYDDDGVSNPPAATADDDQQYEDDGSGSNDSDDDNDANEAADVIHDEIVDGYAGLWEFVPSLRFGNFSHRPLSGSGRPLSGSGMPLQMRFHNFQNFQIFTDPLGRNPVGPPVENLMAKTPFGRSPLGGGFFCRDSLGRDSLGRNPLDRDPLMKTLWVGTLLYGLYG